MSEEGGVKTTIIYQGGVNDRLAPPDLEAIKRNVAEIAEAFRAEGCTVVGDLVPPPPTRD